MSDIPLARRLLEDLAERLKGTDPAAAREIRAIIPLLIREPMARMPAPTKPNRRMTAQKRALILAYHSAYPKASNQEIADRFEVNPGRVSEVIQRRARMARAALAS
jgi:hypothetical protein